MKTSLEKFITEFNGSTFSSSEDVNMFLRVRISRLVEEIYKEELKIADDRWKRAEEKLRNYEQ
jgi:hypothetical protein